MGEDAIRWLYGLQQFGIKLGLRGIRTLLGRLGDPERSFPSILVGGTNGKGSVAAMLDSMLGLHGLRVGFYSSPHLVRPNERIRIAGRDVSEDDLCRWLEVVRSEAREAVADGGLETHPSFFEVMTAAALLAFRESSLDIAILEVGLGGRLDATNAVPAILSCVVTVDLDHTERLGTTLRDIASEKAGIIKPGRPLVSGFLHQEAREVLRDRCLAEGSPFLDVPRFSTIGAGAVPGTLGIRTGRRAYEGLRLALPGRHQIENAQVALAVLDELGDLLRFRVERDAARAGLAAVRWPGRLQWIAGEPPILLDGAHNPSGAESLAAYLRELRRPPPVLVFASVTGKDSTGILKPLRPLVSRVVVTRPPVERASEARALEAVASELGLAAESVQDPRDALSRARRLAGPSGFVLVAGSLYLVGALLADLEGGGAPGPVSM